MPKGSDATFTAKLFKVAKGSARLLNAKVSPDIDAATAFVVVHYAGEVQHSNPCLGGWCLS